MMALVFPSGDYDREKELIDEIMSEDDVTSITGLANYRVPLIDMFMFVYKEVKEGCVTLDDELMEKLEDANRMMNFRIRRMYCFVYYEGV